MYLLMSMNMSTLASTYLDILESVFKDSSKVKVYIVVLYYSLTHISHKTRICKYPHFAYQYERCRYPRT